MKVWAQTLVKNEARWLWYAVSSVAPHVDKILLWDTGSTDGSLYIEKQLEKKFPGKIVLREVKQATAEDFTKVRQEMLDETKSDWFIVLDGDEIWFEDSIKKVIETINREGENIESIVVPTINLVGDIFHFQGKAAGRYKFGQKIGHYNLRAINRNIPGLRVQGVHGVQGWVDVEGKMIQDRDTYKFVDAPYLHATNLRRSLEDAKVIKRSKKFRFELGENFPKDFHYPEVFFRDRPHNLVSPWNTMSTAFKFRAFFETPLRKIKRRVWQGKPGY
jgi:glycosyltransferase involved in cell wall biosynthesis